MNANQLHDAFGELPEELVASVARVRGRKKIVWGPWIAAAACICLVAALGWRVLPSFQAGNEVSESDRWYDQSGSMAPQSGILYDHADKATDTDCYSAQSGINSAEMMLVVQVVKIETGGILVSVLPDQPVEEGCEIRIPVNGQQEIYAVGDYLRIYCDGVVLETWPLQLGELYGIERIETP